MLDRIPDLHSVTVFYRPRAANRPLRSLVVATQGELSETGIFLARDDLRAAELSPPAPLVPALSAAPSSRQAARTAPEL